jgi:hypothetical protein
MRFLALDSWRGIAALCVALYHLNAYGHFYGVPIVRNSHLFVDFFFVLSGFIISYSYSDKLTRLSAAVPFMIRRFGRVWPLHAVMLVAFVFFPLLEWLGCYVTSLCRTEWPFSPDQDPLTTIFTNLLLIHSLGLHNGFNWNWPSWSISTEFWTYALFALVATTLRATLVPVALFVAVACTLIIMLLAPRHMDSTYDFGYFRCVLGFFIGFLTFRLHTFRQLALGRLGTSIEVATVVLVFGFLSLAGTSNATIAAPLIFALCVYVFAHEGGRISAFLRTTPCLRLGQWSYSIYMVHAFILIVTLRFASLAEKVVGQPFRIEVVGYTPKLYYLHSMYVMDISAILYMAIVVALASFTYERVENPARRYFNAVAATYERKSAESRIAEAPSSDGT